MESPLGGEIKLEKVELNENESIDVLISSFRFAQGSQSSQDSILEMISNFIVLKGFPFLPKDEVEIFSSTYTELFRYRIFLKKISLDFYKKIFYMRKLVLAVHRKLSGSRPTDKSSLSPDKMITSGYHAQNPVSEKVEQIVNYLLQLSRRKTHTPPTEKSESRLIEKVVKDLIEQDLKYLSERFIETEMGSEMEVGRPGRMRRQILTDGTNYMEDKYFSYFVSYVLFGFEYDRDVKEVYRKMFVEIRKSDLLKKLKKGGAETKIQEKYDSLISKYLHWHTESKLVVGKV